MAGDSIRNEDKPPPRHAQEWFYSPQRESIGKALSSPARMAGNVFANVDEIQCQRRWNCTTINDAYLTNLPRELVRSMAGFPTYGRFFYLGCTALNPPTSLCKKAFPAIGKLNDRLVAKEPSPGNPIQPTIAENAFVQNSTPAISFGNIQSSLIQPICHAKGKSTS
ncbi:hypothetical protein [Absidia glauca]|uniref:Ndc10 domain-containing protein n=1 Tax=Absidia glauca TaxID=4829 RepID=A0A163JQ62_ABSGL|nr:hypothetical protein [Absidia glauca]